MKTVCRTEICFPQPLAKLLMLTASDDPARIILSYLHVEFADDTSTLVTTDTHRMCIVTSKLHGGFAGNYKPLKPAKDFWELEKVEDTEKDYPNWRRVIPDTEKHVHIATVQGAYAKAVYLRADQPLYIDLRFLNDLALTGTTWTITGDPDKENSPYVATAMVDAYDVKCVLMPCSRGK